MGKSDAIRGLCEEEGIGFLDIRLAQREPVDVRGLPVPRGDTVAWLVPSEWPREGRGIVFFDELTSADRSLQVAAYELLLDRKLGDLYRVPDGWYLCAAGNRAGDRAVSLPLPSALSNRFLHLEIAADVEDWSRWALSHGVHLDVVSFLRFRPERLLDLSGDLQQGWPSPRSWERVGFELTLAEETQLGDPILTVVLEGLVGTAAATEFLAFRRWASDLPAIEPMLRGQVPWEIPERAEMRWALCQSAVRHATRDEGLISGLLHLGALLPSDLAVPCLLDWLERGDDAAIASRAESMFRQPGFAEWKRKHGDVLRSRFR